MVVVEFSEGFEKELKKNFSKKDAISTVKKLIQTKPTDGDYLTSVGNIILKEKRQNSFRFYYVQRLEETRFLSKEELKDFLIKFIALSKKNNQQKVIDKIKSDLKEFGLDL